MLEVKALSRRYENFVAVANASFTIERGEIVGLLGHNGAGKTTIMKMLSGYIEPNAGTIRINGKDLEKEAKSIQGELGYLPENLPVYPEMSVADYLDYAAELKGISGEEKARDIKRVVEATEIGSKFFSPIATLSRGFKQRVGVSQAILGKPKLLILDEPTNGLDPEQTQHMRELIRTISESATVILSTHIMQEVDALCDRVLILRSGELVVDEKLEVLQQSNELEISSDCEADVIQELIKQYDAIKSFVKLESGSKANRYRVSLTNPAGHQEMCAKLAKLLVENGHNIYQLAVKTRDLESVFRDVNAGKEVAKNVA